ncbi:WD40 repeat-like protein [Abortiporus biennis]|nr:WD40 repeat-like protein [Abortiporus biennis]
MENDATFVAPEGVYSVTEEHKPSQLGVHTVSAIPNSHSTKLTTVIVKYPATKNVANNQVLAQLLGGGNRDREKEYKKEKEKTSSKDNKEDGVSASSSDTPDVEGQDITSTSSPIIPEATLNAHDQVQHNTIFHQTGGSGSSGGKKKSSMARPKHNMRTTSSTFITRLQNVDNLSKYLQSKQGEVTFLFYNMAKSFIWTEVGSKLKEPLARIFFSAYPTCHDVNLETLSPERIDVIIGFNTGDILWFDPISSRYGRLNKQGRICGVECTSIRWVPKSPNLFLVSHTDGTILVYDKEREDGAFSPQEPTAPLPTPPSLTQPFQSGGIAPPTPPIPGEWNPLDSIFVTMPPWHPVNVSSSNSGSGANNNGGKEKIVAKNPVSHWKVTKKSIIDFVFSPDVKYVAAISEDGCLRVIDAIGEQLVDCYASYFGALACIAWSPDGRYILTGGQDDLVTIYSPWEQRVIARCQGHSSFVSALAFDDIRCDGRTYRFGSVGEDNKLILWDFSSGALHRPKLHVTHHQRISMTSSVSLATRRRGESTLYLPPLGSSLGGESPILPRYHPSPSRNEVAVVQPVLIKHIETDLLTDIKFLPRGILTSNRIGYIKFWIRPIAAQPRHLKNGSHRTGGINRASIDPRDWIN